MAQASRKRTSRSSSPLPGWVWLLAGLAIGLSIAFFSYIKGRANSAATVPPPLPPVAAPADKLDKKTPVTSEKKPRLDFYTILPEMEVIVPQHKGNKPVPVDQPGTYILQTGSFRNFAEADSQKAQLALLGVESKVETVTVNNTDTWHRVRVGPYTDLRQLDKIRTRLLNNNIYAVLLKVKE